MLTKLYMSRFVTVCVIGIIFLLFPNEPGAWPILILAYFGLRVLVRMFTERG